MILSCHDSVIHPSLHTTRSPKNWVNAYGGDRLREGLDISWQAAQTKHNEVQRPLTYEAYISTFQKGIPINSRKLRGWQWPWLFAQGLRLRAEAIRRGWFLGSDELRRELVAAAVERVGPSHYGSDRHETGLEKAERIVREETQRMGWQEHELQTRRKGIRVK